MSIIMDKNTTYGIREFFSLGGKCAYACKHCYTFRDGYEIPPIMSVHDVVNGCKNGKFDIAYVSGHRDSFISPEEGIELCEGIYDLYGTDVLLTTRNVFNDRQIARLAVLNERMLSDNRFLFVCSSVPATDSASKLENLEIVPAPAERMAFLQSIYSVGIYTLLTLRPVCPDSFIPTNELRDIIRACKSFSSAVIASGMLIDDSIRKRIPSFPNEVECRPAKLNQYLKNDDPISDVDVEKELAVIEEECSLHNLPFFRHSLPAINHIKSRVF